MEIKYKKIIHTDAQIDELYVLLESRRYSISHSTINTKIVKLSQVQLTLFAKFDAT
jgi:hypothetical protein